VDGIVSMSQHMAGVRTQRKNTFSGIQNLIGRSVKQSFLESFV
jgi:hypothetical protein